MSEVHIKATPVLGLAGYIKSTLSPAQQARLQAQLGPGEARVMEGRLLASETVPVDVSNRLTDLAARECGQTPFEFGRAAGRVVAELGTRTVYKFILALLSPQSMLRTAPTMWSRVYDAGRLVAEAGDGRGRLTLLDFPGRHEGFCGRTTGWFEFIGEKAARNMRVSHAACRLRGDPECAWDFAWSK